MACCPGPCSTQIIFPDTITFLGTALGESGLSRFTIGSAVYSIYSPSTTTTNSIGYGGGCDTVCCCPCSVSFTTVLALGVDSYTNQFSGTFTVKFESNCAIVEPTTLYGINSTISLQGSSAVLSCNNNIRTTTIQGLTLVHS